MKAKVEQNDDFFDLDADKILAHGQTLSPDAERKYLQGALIAWRKKHGNHNPEKWLPASERFVDKLKSRIKEIEYEAKTSGKTVKKKIQNEQELIWWKGKDTAILYIFELLYRAQLIDNSQYEQRFALIAAHFKNKKNQEFKNTQLAATWARMKEDADSIKKPNKGDTEEINLVIKQIKNLLKADI